MCELSIKWPIITKLNRNFLEKSESVYIFGQNGENVFIIRDCNVYAYGDNTIDGILGLGHTTAASQPTPIPELCRKNVTRIEFGAFYHFALAITKSGAIYSWGFNAYGQLGNCNTTLQLKPVCVDDLTGKIAVDIQTGANHALALTETGEVYIWGRYVGSKPRRFNLHFGANHRIVSIASGLEHVLALTDASMVFCWGDNQFGQLGNGNNNSTSGVNIVPDIGHIRVSQIACGPYHSLLLSNSGTMYCFGDNRNGQVGDRTNDARNTPTRVVSSAKFVDIEAVKQYNISIGLSNDGYCYVWGECGELTLTSPFKTAAKHINDALECYSKFKVTYEPISFDQISDDSHQSLLLDKISEKFDKSQFSDIKFTFADTSNCIYAQKSHLINVSEYFERMFSNQWRESNANEIEIADYSYAVYYAFLKYLYTESVDISDESLFDLLELANCYLEEVLRKRCEKLIKRSITHENVIATYFAVSNARCNSPELKKYIYKYFSKAMRDETSAENILENAVKKLAK